MMFLFHMLISLVIGAAAGFIAATLMKLDSSNMLFNCVLGIVGGIVGGIIGGIFQIGPRGIFGDLLFATAGACLVVWLYKKFAR
jgi:uncharacterized membrane protein YeaQ/YmgE (transglycosylase-associated protein family)